VTLSDAIVGKCFQFTDSGAHKLKLDHERAAKAHESIIDAGVLLLARKPRILYSQYSGFMSERSNKIASISIPDPRKFNEEKS